ncbi:MAG: DUF2798 domain-containing protein [Planctomycetota bacterium]|nr:DUF2798 domain-containing protein [Planctomycetota bacterium]
MLSRTQANIVSVALIAFTMSGVMSLAMVIVNTGLGGALVGRWMRSWVIAFIIALPVAFIVIPAIRRLVGRFAR